MILFFSIAGISVFYTFEKVALSVVLQRDTELAYVIAERLSASMNTYKSQLTAIAGMQSVRRFNPSSLKKIMRTNPGLFNVFNAGIALYDLNGTLRVSEYVNSNTDLSVKGTQIIRYIEKIKNNYTPVLSDVVKTKKGSKNLIIIITPVIGADNRLKGVLAGSFILKYSFIDHLFVKVLEFSKGWGGFCYLVDRNGIIIYHHYRSRIGEDISSEPIIKRVIRGETGAELIINRQGTSVVSGFSSVPDTDWSLITEQHWDQIFQPVNTIKKIFFLILAFSVVLFSVIIYLGTGFSLIRPILNLVSASNEIADKNNYNIRIESRSSDEIGQLCSSFNKMLTQIEKRDGELSSARNMMTSMINSMPSIIISVDRNGIITHWNTSAAEKTKTDAPSAQGKHLQEILPELAEYLDYLPSVVESGHTVEFYRKEFYHDRVPNTGNEGSIYNISLYPQQGEDVEGMIIRIDDISETEKKEQLLRQAQKMETIGTLAGGIAHDFNNMLGGIMAPLSILEMKLEKQGGITNKDFERYLPIIKNSAQKSSELVKQLLTMTRKQEMNIGIIDLNTTLENVTNICKSSFDRCVEIASHPYKEPVIIKGDSTQIEQVILNLAINSVHAMTIKREKDEPRGGRLTMSIDYVSHKSPFLLRHPEAEKNESYWKLSVEDTGIGMEKDFIKKIFDPFFTTKDKGVGTGLGLTMVYSIVKEHRGFIDINSSPGEGTTFNLFFQEYSGKEITTDEQIKKPHFRGSGLILVADDEEVMRLSAKAILEECGYEVIMASDGQEAVELFRENHLRIKAVLLDMIMPRKSGRDVFTEIKDLNNNVKVLLTSGFRMDERVEEVMKLGIDIFIQKPYTMDTLCDAMQKIFDRDDSGAI